MTFSTLSQTALADKLRHGIQYRIGPFVFSLKTALPHFAETLQAQYQHYPLCDDQAIADFHITIKQPMSIRRWLQPQITFHTTPQPDFAPFPQAQALPLLEWGTNWCVATHAHFYLMLHSAVLEKNQQGLILPAWPGSGKSTLCTALSLSGYRFLSDEFALIPLGHTHVLPFPKLAPLKNASIQVIQNFQANVTLSRTYPKTRKGDLAYFQPPIASIKAMDQTVEPKWIIFPKYNKDAAPQLTELTKPQALMKLANNAFNYHILGQNSFTMLRRIVDQSRCFKLEYPHLDDAITQIDKLLS